MNLPGKQRLRAAVTVLLLASHPMLFAAREEHTFEVTVSIPTLNFYVIPVDPGFLEKEQQMKWDLARERFEPIRAFFDVASSTAITAHLGYEPTLASDRFTIPLAVTFNKQALTLNPVEVVKGTGAYIGTRVPLQIEAIEPADGFMQGEYYGSVQIIFDSQPAAAGF